MSLQVHESTWGGHETLLNDYYSLVCGILWMFLIVHDTKLPEVLRTIESRCAQFGGRVGTISCTDICALQFYINRIMPGRVLNMNKSGFPAGVPHFNTENISHIY